MITFDRFYSLSNPDLYLHFVLYVKRRHAHINLLQSSDTLNAQKFTAAQENIDLFGLLRFKTHRLAPIGCINKVTTDRLERSAEGYSHQRDFGLLSELFFSSHPLCTLHLHDGLLILHVPSIQVTLILMKDLLVFIFHPLCPRMDFFFSADRWGVGAQWHRSQQVISMQEIACHNDR